MKKFIKTFISLTLVILLVFTSFACEQEENEVEIVKETFNGVHIMNATDTDSYMVNGGSTTYKIVYPEAYTAKESTAKSEFISLFKQATGVQMEAITDTGLTHQTDATYISIGYTTLLKSVINETELEAQKKELGKDGVRIFTKDKTVYMYGGSDSGTIYSVYDFMEILFNFDQYYRNCFDLDTGITTVKLKNFDVKDIPDIPYRFSPLGVTKRAQDAPRSYEIEAGVLSENLVNRDLRMRFIEEGNSASQIIPIHTEFNNFNSSYAAYHNTDEYINGRMEDKVDYSKASKWVSDNGNQLCYTAHGDEDAFTQLVEQCARKIVNSLSNYTDPTRCYVTITQEDNTAFCSCEHCMKSTEECNGSIAGAMVNLCNRVIDRVDEILETEPEHEAYKREIKMVCYAYQTGSVPPAVYNEETKEWTACKEYAKPNDKVCIWFCGTMMSFRNGIYQPENDEARKRIDGWKAIAPEMWFWLYDYYYIYPAYFCDNFSFINSETFNYLATTNPTMVFDEMGSSSASDVTGFTNLKLYLESKLMWNSSLNSDELTKKFFKAMYKEASDDMYAVFNFMRDYMSINFQDQELRDHTGADINKTKYFPYSTYLKPLLEMLDKAVEKLDVYKTTDIGTYNLIKSRIAVEYVFPLYAVLDLYATDGATQPFTNLQKAEYKTTFREMAEKYYPNYDVKGGSLITFINSK